MDLWMGVPNFVMNEQFYLGFKFGPITDISD